MTAVTSLSSSLLPLPSRDKFAPMVARFPTVDDIRQKFSAPSGLLGDISTQITRAQNSAIGGSRNVATPAGSSTRGNGETAGIAVDLLEREAMTIDDAALSSDDFELRKNRQSSTLILDDRLLSANYRNKLSNLFRSSIDVAELVEFGQSFRAARSVTLLLLSTFSDFQAERHYLHTTVFADLRDQLRSDCQVELNIVDVWLGVESETALTPTDWRNFEKMLKAQVKAGTPIITIVLSGHKYGLPVPSPVIDELAMNVLLNFSHQDPESMNILNGSYWPDIGTADGKTTPVELPAHERRRFILREDILEPSALSEIGYLVASASVYYDGTPESILLPPRVCLSGPEMLLNAVLPDELSMQTSSLIVLLRRVAGLRENTHLPICRLYCDVDVEAPSDYCQRRLRSWQERLQTGAGLPISACQTVSFELKISDLNGVNCERHTRFDKHLGDVGKAVFQAVKESATIKFFRRLDKRTEHRADTFSTLNALDVLTREATLHLLHACEIAPNCLDRQNLVDAIISYVTTPCRDVSATSKLMKPLGVLGSPGCGHSTLLAAVVQRLALNNTRTDRNLICIPRFVNVTPISSNVRLFLKNIMLHLSYIIGGTNKANHELELPDDVASLKLRLIHELQLLRNAVTLVLIVDGVEFLTPSPGQKADATDWLPSVLSERVRVVVALKSDNADSVERFVARYGEDSLLYVEPLNATRANNILKSWFVENGHRLVHSQWQALRNAIDGCLINESGVSVTYLKLIREASCRWFSFSQVSPDYFGASTQLELDRIFSQLECDHGVSFVRHILAFLTAAQLAGRGLSLAELFDVASLDNFVLYAVALHGRTATEKQNGRQGGVILAEEASKQITELKPKSRPKLFGLTCGRVPTLAIYGLFFELNAFLAERIIDSLPVIVWADSVVFDFVRKRYLDNDIELNRFVYSTLADYYAGTWSGPSAQDLRLSVCDPSGNSRSQLAKSSQAFFTVGQAIRHVVRQPLRFDDSCQPPDQVAPNLRKLVTLPDYLIAAGRLRDLAEIVLFDLDWLMTKLAALGVDSTLSDFSGAVSALSKSGQKTICNQASVVGDAIRYSRSYLNLKPAGLPGQLLARLLVYSQSATLAATHKNLCRLLNQCDRASIQRNNSLVPLLSLLDTPSSPRMYAAKVSITTGSESLAASSTVSFSPSDVVLVQTQYQLILGLKPDGATSARFWAACGCGALGPGWFCPPIRGLPPGRIYRLASTRGSSRFAVLSNGDRLLIFHLESGELLSTIELNQQLTIKQLVSSERYAVLIPGSPSTFISNGASRPTTASNSQRPTSSASTGSSNALQAPLQSAGPILIDFELAAVVHRFPMRPGIAAVSQGNEVFAFSVNEITYVHTLPLAECIHTFQTESVPVMMHIVPPNAPHHVVDEVRLIVLTALGHLLQVVVSRKFAKHITRSILPHREATLSTEWIQSSNGAMGLFMSPNRLYLVGLREGSIIQEFEPPTSTPAHFTSSCFATMDQQVAGALNTGQICIFRIGDLNRTTGLRVVESTTPGTISYLYGSGCCSRLIARIDNPMGFNYFHLNCWDVDRLSTPSSIHNHSQIIVPGGILCACPSLPYAATAPQQCHSPSHPIALLSASDGRTVRVFDLASRNFVTNHLQKIVADSTVTRMLLSPDGQAIAIFDADSPVNPTLYAFGQDLVEAGQVKAIRLTKISDLFFAPNASTTTCIATTLTNQIQVYKLVESMWKIVREIDLTSTLGGEMHSPVLLPNGIMAFLGIETAGMRAKEQMKFFSIDVISTQSMLMPRQLYEMWPDGGMSWELAELLPIPGSKTALLAFVLPAVTNSDMGACFAYDLASSSLLWTSIGSKPNPTIIPQSFLPLSRLPGMLFDCLGQLAFDVDMGCLYDIQMGVRVRSSISTPCCRESFRFLLKGEYFTVLSVDRRKILSCRTKDEAVVAEFDLYAAANSLEVLAVDNERDEPSRRIVIAGLEDGRLIALGFVTDLLDPIFELLHSFRKPT